MQQTGLADRNSCVTPPKIHSPNRRAHSRRPRLNLPSHPERDAGVQRRPLPALAATRRAPRLLDGGEGSPRRRKESFWHWIPLRLRRLRRAGPLWPAAETELHHARRGGTHACLSTPPPPRGGAAAERRCRGLPGRVGPPVAGSRRDRQNPTRCGPSAVLRR